MSHQPAFQGQELTRMGDVVHIGSRAGRLARTQVAEWLAPIAGRFPGVPFKREVILEGGDQDRVTPTLAEVARTAGGSAFSTSPPPAPSRPPYGRTPPPPACPA
ncbi:hypothetical protein [Streptomyces bauhiniae]|uniref:hypothetical protein n=1 Tax=Streptomyces bauhiniae TaxID=2340725 RepID=UPI0035D5700E